MHYEIWDYQSGNLVNDFDDTQIEDVRLFLSDWVAVNDESLLDDIGIGLIAQDGECGDIDAWVLDGRENLRAFIHGNLSKPPEDARWRTVLRNTT